MMLKFKLLKLHCYLSDESEADEVFLKYNQNKIWPQDAKYTQMSSEEQSINLDLPEVEIDTMLELELWDHDTWTPNDKLGIFRMIVDAKGGPFVSDLVREKGSGAKYSLEWEVD